MRSKPIKKIDLAMYDTRLQKALEKSERANINELKYSAIFGAVVSVVCFFLSYL